MSFLPPSCFPCSPLPPSLHLYRSSDDGSDVGGYVLVLTLDGERFESTETELSLTEPPSKRPRRSRRATGTTVYPCRHIGCGYTASRTAEDRDYHELDVGSHEDHLNNDGKDFFFSAGNCPIFP